MTNTKYKLHECLSKVTITDQFTKRHMQTFLSHKINAELVQESNGKKIRLTRDKVKELLKS